MGGVKLKLPTERWMWKVHSNLDCVLGETMLMALELVPTQTGNREFSLLRSSINQLGNLQCKLWHGRGIKLEQPMLNILGLDSEVTNLCSVVHWCGRAAELLVTEMSFSDQQRTWLSPCALNYSAGIQQTRGHTNDPFLSIMDPKNWSPVSNHLWLVSPT